MIKLIFINAIIFILLETVSIISTLFKIPIPDFSYYLSVPALIPQLITRPWSIITYMFVHANIFHIFFNMLMLYWFGKIFLTYFNSRNMGVLYFLGGLGGAILYIAAFNFIPYYIDMKDSIMVGASGAVMAIVFASAFYHPDQKLIFFVFPVKIIYIALALFVIDFFALRDPSNPGGHVAHIGGAIVGLVFALQYKKGRDITAWFTSISKFFSTLFKPKKKTKMKVKVGGREADYEYNRKKNIEQEDIDRILDKIKASGYSSLTKEEKRQLFDASRK
nr:rhomboid family intramembrane serine protease [Dysgonomonas sp. 216]